jgi:hypothetical protein
LKQRELAVRSSGIELAACGIKTQYGSEKHSDFRPKIRLLSSGYPKRAKFAGETEKKRAFFVVRGQFRCVVRGSSHCRQRTEKGNA